MFVAVAIIIINPSLTTDHHHWLAGDPLNYSGAPLTTSRVGADRTWQAARGASQLVVSKEEDQPLLVGGRLAIIHETAK